MRTRWLIIPVVAAAATLTSFAVAETGSKPETKPATPATGESSRGSVAGIVRRDPAGVTGVSPFTEAVLNANVAFLARDFPKAIEGYQDAIKKSPDDPMGPYLLGEAQLVAGKLDEADTAWASALRLAGKDVVVHAKVLFVIADLRERQGRWDDADAAWKEYGTFVGANAKANGYSATATERQKMIATHKDLAVKYGKVKERIQQRLEETRQEAQKKPEPKKGK